MGHVACTAHSRRVVIIGKKVIHRNGDGSRCMSFTLKKGGSIWPRDTVFDMIEANNAGRGTNYQRLTNAIEAHYSYLTE